MIKRLTGLLGATLLLIAALLTGFHFWLVHHSEKAVEDLIGWASNGKLHSSIKKVRLDYFHNSIEIRDLNIVNTDSSAEATAYRFSVREFHLKLRSLWDFVFYKELLIDSVVFNAPDVVVIGKAQPARDTSSSRLLLARELGDIYQTISQSLSVLHLQRFEIHEGKVFINNAFNQDKTPFRLSHIFLSIDKFSIDSSSAKETNKFIFSDRILVRINDQHILLPDSRSSVGFRELLIDSKGKSIRIDHPFFRLLPGSGSGDSIIAAAAGLHITGLDFNALYQQQAILADSLLLQEPDALLQLHIGLQEKKKNGRKKTTLDSALYHLPVSLRIGHIVMQHGNASIHLDQQGKMTSFETKNDNLSLRGLRINDSLENFMDIAGFDYMIRDYVGFTPDSVYRFHFDSLQFVDNKIVLHHFVATTFKQARTNLIRNYSVPRLEITGMDWASFFIDNHFIAHGAVLYDPILNIEKNNTSVPTDTGRAANKRSIYQTLSVMDSLLDLNSLQIINGRFSYTEPGSLSLSLQHLKLDISADALTQAKSFDQIVRSVKRMSFDSADASSAAASLSISRSYFSQEQKVLVLKDVYFHTVNGEVTTRFSQVGLSDFSFNNRALEVNGLHWKDAKIDLTWQHSDHKQETARAPSLLLNHISGENTALSFHDDHVTAALFLNNLSLNSLNKPLDGPFRLSDLVATGRSLQAAYAGGRLTCDSFYLQEGGNSTLQNIALAQENKGHGLRLSITAVRFTTSFDQWAKNGLIDMDTLTITKPAVTLMITAEKSQSPNFSAKPALPALHISELKIREGSFQSTVIRGDLKSSSILSEIALDIRQIQTGHADSVIAGRFSLAANHLLYKPDDSTTLRGDANILLSASHLFFQPSNDNWGAMVDRFLTVGLEYTCRHSLKGTDSVGLRQVEAQHLLISSAELKKALAWGFNRSHALVTVGYATYQSGDMGANVEGLRFDQNNRTLTMEAFSAGPTMNREDFIKNLSYRKDYIRESTEKVRMEGMEMEGGELRVPFLSLGGGRLQVYSDKLVKAGPPSDQPLPAGALETIPSAIRVDHLHIQDIVVSYTEHNADTRRTGSVLFSQIKGDIFNLATSKTARDSIQAHLSARLMDSMRLQLSLHESYSDPLHGFLLRVQLGPGRVQPLNAFLVPLVSMQAKSGFVDTMTLVASADNRRSRGSMRLYYHDLKADFLDSGSMHKKSLGTRLLNFVASAVAVKSHNNSRVAYFDFYRIQEKSSIGYLLQMVVEGSARSVAPLSTVLLRKQDKKARKGLPNSQK